MCRCFVIASVSMLLYLYQLQALDSANRPSSLGHHLPEYENILSLSSISKSNVPVYSVQHVSIYIYIK